MPIFLSSPNAKSKEPGDVREGKGGKVSEMSAEDAKPKSKLSRPRRISLMHFSKSDKPTGDQLTPASSTAELVQPFPSTSPPTTPDSGEKKIKSRPKSLIPRRVRMSMSHARSVSSPVVVPPSISVTTPESAPTAASSPPSPPPSPTQESRVSRLRKSMSISALKKSSASISSTDSGTSIQRSIRQRVSSQVSQVKQSLRRLGSNVTFHGVGKRERTVSTTSSADPKPIISHPFLSTVAVAVAVVPRNDHLTASVGFEKPDSSEDSADSWSHSAELDHENVDDQAFAASIPLPSSPVFSSEAISLESRDPLVEDLVLDSVDQMPRLPEQEEDLTVPESAEQSVMAHPLHVSPSEPAAASANVVQDGADSFVIDEEGDVLSEEENEQEQELATSVVSSVPPEVEPLVESEPPVHSESEHIPSKIYPLAHGETEPLVPAESNPPASIEHAVESEPPAHLKFEPTVTPAIGSETSSKLDSSVPRVMPPTDELTVQQSESVSPETPPSEIALDASTATVDLSDSHSPASRGFPASSLPLSPVSKDVLPPIPQPQEPLTEEDAEEEVPDLYLPGLTKPTMFLPIPNTDPLTTLLTKYIYPPEQRPLRDISGEWKGTNVHTLVMTNSWRALARMARDRIVTSDPADVETILGLWYIRLASLARLRLSNQTAAECTNLFAVLNAIEPIEAREWVFKRILPFELDVMNTRVKYWSGDHMGYVDALCGLLRMCKKRAREAEKEVGTRKIEEAQEFRDMWKERGSRICLILASQLVEMKDFTAATKLLQPLCTQPSPDDPTRTITNPALRSAIARIYLQGGNVQQAAYHFALVAQDPTADEPLKKLNAAILGAAEGDWEKSVKLLRELVEKDAENYVAVNNLAVNLLCSGKLREAIQVLESALEASPSTVVIAEPFLFNLSTLYELRSAAGLEKKKDLLIEVAKWSGDGLRISCLKMPTN